MITNLNLYSAMRKLGARRVVYVSRINLTQLRALVKAGYSVVIK